MLKAVAIGVLFSLWGVNSLYYPQNISAGGVWNDYFYCDTDQWAFSNPDPNFHARHRDGDQDLTEGKCYYGAWSGESDGGYGGTNDNYWGATQWFAYEADGHTPLIEFDLEIHFRLFAYCDYEPSDQIWVVLKDEWVSLGADPDNLADDIWGRERELTRKQKFRNNCDGWTQQMSGQYQPSWFSEVGCTNGNNGVSCFYDYTNITHIHGSRFGMRFQTDLNNGWLNEAWAYGAIHLQINPYGTTQAPATCCTGTRSDHPNKSCGAFHEQRNCEAKGCDWDSENAACEITCCRFDDKQTVNKEKPQCKDYNFAPNICDTVSCLARDECSLSKCDVIGMGDNTDGIEGNGK